MEIRQPQPTQSVLTMEAAREFRRRSILQAGVAAGALAAVSPVFSRRSLAQNREVEIYTWNDYITADVTDAFTAATGIRVNRSVYGTNNEVLNVLRASQGAGYDLVFPGAASLQSWYDAGDLLQPIDESRIPIDNVIPAIWERSLDLGATRRGRRYALPYSWGTEGIAFDSHQRDYAPGRTSWNDVWSDQNQGLVTARPRSAMTVIGIMLDGTGEMMDAAYHDEAVAREVFDQALDFAIDHKPWVRQFWKDTPAIQNAFLQNNAMVGICWDGPSLNLWRETDGRIKYLSPNEGALTWLDTMCIPSGARNIDEAYEFMSFVMTAEIGAAHANHSGYNTAVDGAVPFLTEDAREKFNYAYNNGALIDQLYWWKPEPQWFLQVRQEYIERYEAA